MLPLRVFIYFYFFVQICFHFKSLPSPIHLTLFTVFPLWQYIIEKQKEVFLLFSSFFSYFFDLFTLFFSFYSFFGTFFHFLYLFHVLDAKLHKISRLGQLWSVALPWPVICLSKSIILFWSHWYIYFRAIKELVISFFLEVIGKIIIDFCVTASNLWITVCDFPSEFWVENLPKPFFVSWAHIKK